MPNPRARLNLRVWAAGTLAGLALCVPEALADKTGGLLRAQTGGGTAMAYTVEELAWAFLWVVGAAATGATLAYHPHYRSQLGSLEALDQPKIFITYTIVGALVGVVVQKDEAMGLAIFGIGGLMRFRTLLPSAKDTGRLILATLIGISWGVGAWLLALLVTVFAWLLVLVLDWKVAYRIVVRGLTSETLSSSLAAYQSVLADARCRVVLAKQHLRKEQISIVFRSKRSLTRDDFEALFETHVPEDVRGNLDWTEQA